MPQELTQETPRDVLLRTAKELGLSMTSEFVPFSRSRNKSEKLPSLNWKVTLKRDTSKGALRQEYPILTTDYMAGSGHCPSYKQSGRSAMGAESVAWECENGYPARHDGHSVHRRFSSKPLKPDMADVLYSLVSDASVLDSSSFEDWASDLGYDPDSRSAEKTYRACLEIALKLRNGIGEDGLQQLREACQDY